MQSNRYVCMYWGLNILSGKLMQANGIATLKPLLTAWMSAPNPASDQYKTQSFGTRSWLSLGNALAPVVLFQQIIYSQHIWILRSQSRDSRCCKLGHLVNAQILIVLSQSWYIQYMLSCLDGRRHRPDEGSWNKD